MLRAVLHADVRVLDPIWTTQTIANIHGMLVYDTLFGNDDEMQPRPQMVDTYEVSEDKLVYVFTLRDKLRFHDGAPVTTKDVIASLQRWGKKDGVGQRLFGQIDKLEAIDDKTFRMVLTKPYGMVLESLGKTNSSVAVIMRAQDAATDPQQQVKEAIGSGPFKFAKEQWVPGSKAVYLKNADYVPRPGAEKAQSFAGSKFPGVDRIELVWISDPQTAMSALINGEIDFYENPNIDFYPILEKAKGVKLMSTGSLNSTHGMIRLNHLHPPFNNVKARQAMYHLINQEDFLRAIVGDPKFFRVCHGLITCGSRLASDGGQWFKDHNPRRRCSSSRRPATTASRSSCLAATDHNTITPATQVSSRPCARRASTSMPSRWTGVGGSRRAKKEPPAQGGWNIFVTTTGGVGSSNPVLHTWLGAACDKGLFDWPCDAEVEKLSNDYAFALNDKDKASIARELQARAMEQVVYIPFGQWNQMLAYRADRLDGIVPNTGLARPLEHHQEVGTACHSVMIWLELRTRLSPPSAYRFPAATSDR